MNIEIGGYQPAYSFDLLKISGYATIDGVLNVSLIAGYVPDPDGFYEFLSSSRLAGRFRNAETYAFTTDGLGRFDITYVRDVDLSEQLH